MTIRAAPTAAKEHALAATDVRWTGTAKVAPAPTTATAGDPDVRHSRSISTRAPDRVPASIVNYAAISSSGGAAGRPQRTDVRALGRLNPHAGSSLTAGTEGRCALSLPQTLFAPASAPAERTDTLEPTETSICAGYRASLRGPEVSQSAQERAPPPSSGDDRRKARHSDRAPRAGGCGRPHRRPAFRRDRLRHYLARRFLHATFSAAQPPHS
jgi:hypothetical protein